MKLPLSWLADWNDGNLDPGVIAQRLTMLGLEVEAATPVGAALTPLVAGRVLEVRPHPNADRLSLCRVDVGGGEPVGIVCGARNVRAGGMYPVALPGATLPGGLAIKAARIRGEPSAGMLCSGRELGIDDGADGLLGLDAGIAPGADASALLGLGDTVLDVNVTPNRADCLSVLGLARELAAAGIGRAREPGGTGIRAAHAVVFPVTVQATGDCPRFIGRVIRGIDPQARSPLWLRERLRRAGIRSIGAAVDVTNYVLVELGQPMHAYDLAQLRDGIEVRRARAREPVALLDGRAVEADPEVLVIADGSGAIGLAGIMGGAGTAVGEGTQDLFLECAWFAPDAIAGRARRFGLHTDASVRFERGVDPSLQQAAIERATQLILDIAGGEAGPLIDAGDAAALPVRQPVHLRRQRLARVLGLAIPDGEVTRILGDLRMAPVAGADGWMVTPPPARFDIEREEDLIEEVVRIHGYDRVPETRGGATVRPAAAGEAAAPLTTVAATLIARGYQEAITYSFIPAERDALFGAVGCAGLALSNPISADLAVMRQSLWPGLAAAVAGNLNRQQTRVRLFEIGTRFVPAADSPHREERCVAGVAAGSRWPEQWGGSAKPVDFYDVKADVEALLARAGALAATIFEPAVHPALHPGRAARVSVDGQAAGWLGELHPALAARLGMPVMVLFELQADVVSAHGAGAYRAASVFPSVRRDLAVVVAREVPAATLLAVVREAAPAILRDAFVFDIYTGPQVGSDEKSVAIGLILQDTSRTLTDDDASAALDAARAALGHRLQARIRQ